MRWLILIWLCLGPAMGTAALAQTSDHEERARDIGSQLRCVVCQNQSIEESDAQLAQDMRRLVREQLETGASDAEVIEHIRDSYGDYVLLKPPVQSNTYALWFLPFLFVGLSLIWFWRSGRKTPVKMEPAPLSDEDQRLLKTLMDETP